MGAPAALELSSLGATTTTPEQRHQAALFVAEKADDVDDARELLAMLGLGVAS